MNGVLHPRVAPPGKIRCACAECGLTSTSSTVRGTNGVFVSSANAIAEKVADGRRGPITAKRGMTLSIRF